MKEQINVVIDDEDLQNFLAAKFIHDEEQFGLATIAITDRDNHTIKYMQYERYGPHKNPPK